MHIPPATRAWIFQAVAACALLAAPACKRQPEDALPDPPIPEDTADTGIETEPTTATATTDGMTASCTEQADNLLRWDCLIEHDTPGDLTLTWQDTTTGRALSTTAPADGTLLHTLTIWGIRPESSIDFQLSGPDGQLSGQLVTRALPASVTGPLATTGSSTADALMMPLTCADDPTIGIVDPDGTPIWYQTLSGAPEIGGNVGGFHLTQWGTVIVVADRKLHEFELDGTLVRRLEQGVDFDDPLHHDIYGINGYIYALVADEHTFDGLDYILDGFVVFGQTGLVAEWTLSDHHTPTEFSLNPGGFWNGIFPTANDYSHANSITVAEDGTGWISFRHLDAAIQLDADPNSARFGEIDWSIVGTLSSPFPADYTVTSDVDGPADFINQHHISADPQGRFTLFDNRGPGDLSRGLVLDLEPSTQTAHIVEVYDLGESCGAQGSVYTLTNGHRVITCGTSNRAVEWAPGDPAPSWTLNHSCANGFQIMARAIPVDLPLGI